jgi:hypothetical protein
LKKKCTININDPPRVLSKMINGQSSRPYATGILSLGGKGSFGSGIELDVHSDPHWMQRIRIKKVAVHNLGQKLCKHEKGNNNDKNVLFSPKKLTQGTVANKGSSEW